MADNPLDDLDLAILAHLQDDGRKPFTDIARALDVSVGTVRNRVGKMLEDETVWIYARINPPQLGLNASANIHVSVSPSNLIESVANTVKDFPEVSYVAMLSGEYDLELDVMCRDTAHLTQFIQERLHPVPGVVKTVTSIILRSYLYRQPDLSVLMSEPED
ncbi:MAG: Lrp/AsnC family transcriptional regulator [Chloroflexota bacterium]